jgi:cellulose synthase (UDP-forming)
VIGALSCLLALWYFGWLLMPGRIGNPLLFGLLVVAELFNLAQAVGFWWTAAHDRPGRRERPGPAGGLAVDVLIPTYDESHDVVEPTVAAATQLGPKVSVWLLDDGDRREMASLAARYGAHYLRRDEHEGAKAGNLNHALARTSAPLVAVLDCDHVPDRRFLSATLPYFGDPDVAFVQTPQYYANEGRGGVAAAAWSQQALFFGTIARGKDALGAMFCCGTNVVFRRSALEDAGGFPERSVTEDFELSIDLHERGWRSVYVTAVLARGLGPEDMASYVGQQARWSRGCLSALPRILTARLPWRVRLQYLLSSMFFLSGWTALIYMMLPVVRILTGAQPLASAGADQFLLHFAPYFGLALFTVGIAGAGAYTFEAFALSFANFWVHIASSAACALRFPARFKVTPKSGIAGPQPGAIFPVLVAVSVLCGAALYGLVRSTGAATLNNVAFALLHVIVLVTGAWPALRGGRAATDRSSPQETEVEVLTA